LDRLEGSDGSEAEAPAGPATTENVPANLEANVEVSGVGATEEQTSTQDPSQSAQTEGGAGVPETAGTAGNSVVLKIRRRKLKPMQLAKGEIVVTRRLFRTGESEYLLNGKLCRLRDIQDIFMGTGLGPESYAIIEQGRIGQILSSKPHDRRA